MFGVLTVSRGYRPLSFGGLLHYTSHERREDKRVGFNSIFVHNSEKGQVRDKRQTK